MKQLIAVLILTISVPAWAFPTIGPRICVLSSDRETKIVDFRIRNTTDGEVFGYYYSINLFDARGDRILPQGQTISGYRRRSILPGRLVRERIHIRCRAIPRRVEVEVMLIINTDEGERIISRR
jgi:hypothetical protein